MIKLYLGGKDMLKTTKITDPEVYKIVADELER